MEGDPITSRRRLLLLPPGFIDASFEIIFARTFSSHRYIYLIIIKFSEQSMHLLEVFPKQLVFGLITSLNLRSDYLRIAVYLQSPNLYIAS